MSTDAGDSDRGDSDRDASDADAADPAASEHVINEWAGGIGWMGDPDEAMQRASHLLDTTEGVWLVDPVDFDGLDDLVAAYGEVAGVLLLLDRHTRDADVVARRHGVPVTVPDWMSGVAEKVDAELDRVHADLGDTEYGVHRLIDNALWQEAVLYGEDSGTLVVPEAVGTAAFFRAGDERLGVHPALRLKPPRKLGRLPPERVLVGHGAGVFEDAEAALNDALAGSRRRAPRLYAETVRDFLR